MAWRLAVPSAGLRPRALVGGRSGIDAVHGDTAEELGIEVGGFLGHDFAGGGDAHHLIDVDGIEEKGDLRGAAVDGLESGRGFAFVGEIAFGGDGLRRDAEGGLENSIVEKDDIEFALKRRNGVKKLREVGAAAKHQDVVSALGGFRRGIDADGPLTARLVEVSEKRFLGFEFLGFIGEGEGLRFEPGFEIAARFAPGKIVKIGGEAVRGKNGEAFAAGVDESHHGKIVGAERVRSRRMKAAGA